MATSHYSGSATIYQFPVGGRAGVSGHRNEVKPAVDREAPRAVKSVFEGSWYHQEAILEAENARKN